MRCDVMSDLACVLCPCDMLWHSVPRGDAVSYARLQQQKQQQAEEVLPEPLEGEL